MGPNPIKSLMSRGRKQKSAEEQTCQVQPVVNGVPTRGFQERQPKEQQRQVNGVEVEFYSPKRSRDTVGPGNVRRLEKSGSPSPLADNNRGSQTGLDHSTSGAVRIENDRENNSKKEYQK
jgi:hypothetical protein